MRIRILASSTERPVDAHYALSVLVNDAMCIDAGCLGFVGEQSVQKSVKHVFLSHGHIDHVGSLPIFLENTFDGTRDCATVYASAAVHASLQKDVFNDRIWPDFIRLSTPEAPFLKSATLEAGRPVAVNGLSITPIEVTHGTPTFGFIVDDGDSAFAFSADTAPTEMIWKAANDTPNLKAVFLECSFPNFMAQLARDSYHLTPDLFEIELAKIESDVPVHPISIKARFRSETIRELEAIRVKTIIFPPIGEEFEI